MDLHEILLNVANPLITIIEMIGLFFLMTAFVQALYHIVVIDKLDFQKFNTRHNLSNGMITSLEILMVGEIIRTMTSVTTEHILMVGLLVVIRLFMVYVLEKRY